MRLLFWIFLFSSVFVNLSFAENTERQDPLKLLNEKQEGLFFGSANCEKGSDECLYFFSELLKEVKLDKDLKKTAFLGYSSYWYGDVLFRQNRFEEAFEVWENMISDEIFNEDHNLRFKNYALIGLGWAYFTEAEYLNDAKSFKYMKMAADYGNEMALNNLGVFYEMGRNTKKNMSKAYEHYKKSAELGNHWSHGNIADFYILGSGNVKKNYQRAIFHLKFSSIAFATKNDNLKLKSLLEKGKLPKDRKEFNQWMISTLKKSKDPNGFQNLAWSVEEISEKYKWHYLASIYSIEKDTKNRSIQEMKVIEKRNNFKLNEIKILKKEADHWIKKNW